MPAELSPNTLFYGDNLDILRRHIPDACVDLIYLDPPFNSARNYNVLFRDEKGKESEAQIVAFEDTWSWGSDAEMLFDELRTQSRLAETMEALVSLVRKGPMGAYLVMMGARLLELHRVLKPTGSLYLHCDPTASHYLKIILDAIFDPRNFRNEITWRRTHAHGDSRRRFANVSDIIFFYTKSGDYTFNVQHQPYPQSYIDKYYRYTDENGRRYQLVSLRSPNPRPNLTYDYKGFKPHANGWAVSREKMEQMDKEGRLHFPSKPDGNIREKYFLDEMPGVLVGDAWDDIAPINSQAAERLGYPTQKPLALLERIIKASSNPGDLVLDPFCGCGTTIDAAQRLGRRWVGIDITHLAIALQKYRLQDAHPGIAITVVGEPEDLGAAQQLARDDRYQFQWWALSLVRARPVGGEAGGAGKKGADKGIDGVITFVDDASSKLKRAIVQVKSGKVSSRDIRDLVGVLDREKAQIGLFVTLEEPTRDMVSEAAGAGVYTAAWTQERFPRVQILTVGALLRGTRPQMPAAHGTFKEAPRARPQGPGVEQQGFDL